MKRCTFIFFLLLYGFAFSQGEANIWYFGGKAGIDFNSGSPVALTDSQMQISEGCTTISNSLGQVLFYSSGLQVWNANHQVMPNGNGLLGSSSSTQSAIAIPKPGSTSIYYLFTTDSDAGTDGANYSEIDMNLNGGLGDITAAKNIQLFTPSCEKVTAVKHENGIDYWVIFHEIYDTTTTNNFRAYLVSGAGVSSTPVISSVGTPIPLLNFSAAVHSVGYLKVSPNGDKIINSVFYGLVELFDFDASTGTISNQKIVYDIPFFRNYGVEFSPSGNLAYLTTGTTAGTFKLLQFDLTNANIPATATLIHEVTNDINHQIGALQLGPDGKLYCTNFDRDYLSVINNPNTLGVGCNFVANGVSLNGRLCKAGLPQFIQSYFSTGIIAENLCLGNTTTFSLTNVDSVIAVSWDFGDGNSGSGLNPNNTYALTGDYTVTATVTTLSETIIQTKDITISAVPTATQPNAILSCDTNNDGFYAFDLTQNTAVILNGQSPTEFAVRYYAHATDYANKIVINNPTNYQNLVGYQSQTIVAEVYNLVNGNCNATTTFDIQVFETPTPASVIPAIRQCDDTSFGTANDNRIIFDLTQNEATILNGQSTSDFTVTYYTDAGFTNMIANPNNYVNGNATETIYVQVINNLNINCVGTTSFEIEVYANPTVNSPVTLQQCDDDNDGFSAFNLTEAEPLIVTNTAGLTIAYFETWTDAQNNTNPIANLIAYTNQIVSSDLVYVRITNTNGCYSISELNLVVSTTLISNTIQEAFTVCDDMASGSNTDGIATFDFSSANAQIVAQYPSGQLLDITYYRNLTDALAEQNAIGDITNYTNIGYPTTQAIYVRVDSQVNNDCLGLGHHITLNVESIPIVPPQSYTHCDDDHDGLYSFNTTTLENDLLNGLSNVIVTYFDALGNPINMTNPFITASQVLTVRVTNNTATACFYETTITFTVDDLPEAFAIPTNLTTVCDDEVNPSLQNGLYAFDTSSFQSTILGTQTGMQVNYYDENGNALTSPLPNPFVTGNQNVLVEVINPANATCTATMTIPFLVNPVPEIDLHGDGLVCSDNTTFTLDIDAGLLDSNTQNDYTYQWFFNGAILPNETNYNLTVNTEGVYTVTVTNMSNCSRTRTITVTASDIAIINDIQITDLSDSNSILVLVSGAGDYEYSLDNSSYQSSNVFTNLEAGIYTVYVNDIYGCGIASKEISVLGIPKFFTPNGDGFNDIWNIQGVNEQLNANTIIYIFDRYGKLVKQISPLGTGWDGTFNGKPLPSSDYWYAIHLEDGRNIKGHFTLKR
ncbi:T9SS type B sorting domain-containing protein [Flavobacterium sp. HNIBRBA15423]|uniref:T9SS type B sorting domain-containing protein n=1 Tax=Flavobacterium sp. HNIBRBA15423 TaxID=3458683 RepID=UPI0040439E29